MAGPNASGKTTVQKEVRKQFYGGPFVNADEIEYALRKKKSLNLFTDYNLEIQDDAFLHFLQGIGKSWKKKAEFEKGRISLKCAGDELLISNEPSPYDAALAADFICH